MTIRQKLDRLVPALLAVVAISVFVFHNGAALADPGNSPECSKPRERRHSERNEESSVRRGAAKILRCAQNDARYAQNDARYAQNDAHYAQNDVRWAQNDAARPLQADQPAGAGDVWFRRALVGMEVGPTGANYGQNSDPTDTRFCAKFDGRDIVRRCVAAGCDYAVIWGRDGDWAYYDSKLLPKTPGLGARNPLRDAVDEAHKRGLPLSVYCVVQGGGNYLNAHPEFLARTPDGKPRGIFCFNSGYLEVMKKILSEQLAYGVDSCTVDMMTQTFEAPYTCWCDTCRKQFQAQYHRPMPNGATWDEDWDRMLEFRYQSSQRFEQALREHVKSVNPKAMIYFNYHGFPPFSFDVGQRPVQHAGIGDFVTGETGAWMGGPLTYGLMAEFFRATTPGRPFQVAMQHGLHMYHDQTTRPLNDLRRELFTLLAHGAMVTIVDKRAYDGTPNPVAYEHITAAFAEAHRKREHFRHTPVYDVGLYFSARSRDWIGREKAEDYYENFFGAQKACAYEHLCYGVVLDENVTLPVLKQFPVVCLPNIGFLSDKEIALLRQYVEEDGRLVVTGQTGLFDRWGKPLGHSAIAGLIGAELERPLTTLDNWFRLPGRMGPGIRPDCAFLAHGVAAVYRPTAAMASGELLKPVRGNKEYGPWPLSADSPVGPAILVNRLGKGTVVTLAFSPDAATASRWPVPEARKLLASTIRELNPHPRVRVTAPQSVESVVTDDPATRTLRVHLIACQAPPQTMIARDRPTEFPAMIEDDPLYRVKIETAERLTDAQALNPTTELSLSGNHVEATVSDIHEVLVLKY